MSDHHLSDLLPITSGVSKPNAYEVFGLTTGEHDTTRIQQTIQTVIKNLKACKSNSDSKRWKAAAKLATDSRMVLSDPTLKSELDLRLGVFAEVGAHGSMPSLANDPLAAYLPGTDPLETYHAEDDPLIESSSEMEGIEKPRIETPGIGESGIGESGIGESGIGESGIGESGIGEISFDQIRAGLESETLLPSDLIGVKDISEEGAIELPSFEVSPEFANDETNSGVVVNNPSVHRRKRSKTGALIPAAFAFFCFSIVGLVLFFIIQRPGVVITVSDDGFSVNTAPTDVPIDPVVGENERAEQQKANAEPPDPVMGGLGNSKNDEGKPGQFSDAVDPDMPKRDTEPSSQTGNQQMNSAPTDSKPEMDPTSKDSENRDPDNNDDDQSMEDEKEMDSEPEALSDEVLAEAEQALEQVRQAIIQADWNRMDTLAKSTLEKPMSDEQSKAASDLAAVADLATYYRQAVVRAVNNLNIGNDFEVTSDFRVIIVEKGPDKLVVRYNTQNKAYSFDELPWKLAHKLASFEVPNDAFSISAKAVYQSIAPNTNQGYQDEAMEWITEIQPELDGTDKENIAATLQALTAKK